MNNEGHTIQIVERTFDLIEVLANYPQGAALKELCENTNLTKGTVSRLLSSLINLGYAYQNIENRRYYPTFRMFEVGSKVVSGNNVLTVAQPYINRIAEICGEVVQLVTRVEDDVVYLYKEEGSSSLVRMTSYVGRHDPMYCTGVGKSYLAFLPLEDVKRYWERIEHVKYTENTIVDYETFIEELKQIKEQGYAIDNEEQENGVKCVAAPILKMNSEPIAAISISAPSIRMTEQFLSQYIPLVTETAKNISRYYGSRY